MSLLGATNMVLPQITAILPSAFVSVRRSKTLYVPSCLQDSEAPQPSPGRRHANPAAVALLPAPSLREAAHGLPQKAQSPTMQQVG